MASRKIYFTDDDVQAELEAFQNDEGKLFISLSDKKLLGDCNFITLDREDAFDLIEELATQFGWLDKTENEQGVKIWNEECELKHR